MKVLFLFLSNSVLPFVLWSLYLQLSECYPFSSVIALQTYSSVSSLKYCSDPLPHSLHSQNSWKNGLYTVPNLLSPIYSSTQYHWASTLNFWRPPTAFLLPNPCVQPPSSIQHNQPLHSYWNSFVLRHCYSVFPCYSFLVLRLFSPAFLLDLWMFHFCRTLSWAPSCFVLTCWNLISSCVCVYVDVFPVFTSSSNLCSNFQILISFMQIFLLDFLRLKFDISKMEDLPVSLFNGCCKYPPSLFKPEI